MAEPKNKEEFKEQRRKVQRMIYIDSDVDEFLEERNASQYINELIRERIQK